MLKLKQCFMWIIVSTKFTLSPNNKDFISLKNLFQLSMYTSLSTVVGAEQTSLEKQYNVMVTWSSWIQAARSQS